MIVQCIEYLRKRQKGALLFFFLIVAAIAVWSLTVNLHHAHTWAEGHVPFFWAFFALIAATVLIFFARWFRACGIKREGDYYDK